METPLKCALFVDFDNMFLGLKEDSPEAAERFGTDPARWLAWIEDKMSCACSQRASQQRTLLIRRCYLNPSTLSQYRPYFARHGFIVVDCPTLTSRGKNSADIVMVMDILDTLRHETHFDEFILMSADADFTPLFLRLRAYDRRTTAIISTPAAAAYRSACDLVVEEGTFVAEALGIDGWKEAGTKDTDPCKPTPAAGQNTILPPNHPLHKLEPCFVDFIRRVHDLTDAPMLTPEQYITLFQVLAREYTAISTASRLEFSQRVRDLCKRTKNPMGIRPISWIINSIDSEVDRMKSMPGGAMVSPEMIASIFYKKVSQVLDNIQAALSPQEKIFLRKWLMGK